MDHKWRKVGNTEWCSWCGTSRLTEEHEGVTKRTYYAIGGDVGSVTMDGEKEIPPHISLSHCHILPPHIMQAIVNWQQTAYAWGRTPSWGIHFRIDAEHSSLLRRLLGGKMPSKEPPPLRNSYPWTKLIEDGWDTQIDIREEKNKFFGHDKTMLYIDQHYWTILEKLGPEEWIVTYHIPDAEEIARQERKRLEDPNWRWYQILPKQASTKWRVWKSGVAAPYNERDSRTEAERTIWSIQKWEGDHAKSDRTE